MLTQSPHNPWFAVHIRMHNQDQVETTLRYKGYDVFGPTHAVARRVGGREKNVQKPLFPGYLFCSLDPQHRLPVLTVPGVISILGVGNVPTPVDAEVIEAIRRTVASGLTVEPFRLMQPGEPVCVKHGPLAGIEGVFVNYRGRSRLVIVVKTLNDRAVSVEMDRSAVTPLPPPCATNRPRVPVSEVGYWSKVAS